MKSWAVVVLSTVVSTGALAQDVPPPTGPAQIIQRAGEARAQAQLQASPAQTAPVVEAPIQAPAGNDPHAGVEGAPAVERRPMNSAVESPELRAGTIRVRIVDGNDRPVARAKVQVGVMKSMGARTTIDATTDEAGITVLGGLDVGEGQAYRVNVLHQGAKYSSNPFRLPAEHGYDVMVRQLDTTRDAAEVVLYIGATSIELQDERLKIVQQARLVNVGQRTYVFPEGGEVIALPAGFLAFQAQDSMTDQHVTPIEGKGLRIEGSLAPGQATLTWGFDLPREGSEAAFSIPLPWRTYAYRVLTDAAAGMTMEVEGMPAPQEVAHDGHKLLVTEIQAQPDRPMLKHVSVRLAGIPGPGAARWVALTLAVFAFAMGLVFAFRRGSSDVAPGRANDRKREIALTIAGLDRDREAGEVGPEFHREERARLIDELAALMRDETPSTSSRAA